MLQSFYGSFHLVSAGILRYIPYILRSEENANSHSTALSFSYIVSTFPVSLRKIVYYGSSSAIYENILQTVT